MQEAGKAGFCGLNWWGDGRLAGCVIDGGGCRLIGRALSRKRRGGAELVGMTFVDKL
jgi:hypothetical protein